MKLKFTPLNETVKVATFVSVAHGVDSITDNCLWYDIFVKTYEPVWLGPFSPKQSIKVFINRENTLNTSSVSFF